MFPSKSLAALALLGMAASTAWSVPVAMIDSGKVDSGWEVSWDESVVSVTVLEVDPVASTVRIAIEKDFGAVEGSGDDIEFPDALISFTPAAGKTPVSQIIIDHETIHNNTGVAWTEFNWIIPQTGAADFLVCESSGWVVAPLSAKTWQDIQGNFAHHLTADEGIIPSGSPYTPSGGLVIDANGTVPFTLKQIVVPEPTCVGLLLAAGAGALLRRTRRRSRSR